MLIIILAAPLIKFLTFRILLIVSTIGYNLYIEYKKKLKFEFYESFAEGGG